MLVLAVLEPWGEGRLFTVSWCFLCTLRYCNATLSSEISQSAILLSLPQAELNSWYNFERKSRVSSVKKLTSNESLGINICFIFKKCFFLKSIQHFQRSWNNRENFIFRFKQNCRQNHKYGLVYLLKLYKIDFKRDLLIC